MYQKNLNFLNQKIIVYLTTRIKKHSKLSHLIQKYHTFIQSEIPHLYVNFSTNDNITSNNIHL